jgi:serine/threonine protein kinase
MHSRNNELPCLRHLPCFVYFVGNIELWKWKENSKVHREKFIKLREYGKTHPKEIKEVSGVRFCCLEEFLLGKGNDGTRVYVGLGKDAYERAVKCLRRDACAGLAEHEKDVLNEPNAKKSNHVANYYSFDDESDKEYFFLIMDLCEETLETFVGDKSLDDLVANASVIIQQVLKGLADLHHDPKPILHRDVKPPNVLRDVHGDWLLADFGISRLLAKGATTHRSKPMGTEDWIAVESYPFNSFRTDDAIVCYKKESDIQVGIFYVKHE